MDTSGGEVCSVGLEQLETGREPHGRGHMDRAEVGRVGERERGGSELEMNER